MSRVHFAGQNFDEDHLSVARGIEVGEEGLLRISAGEVEGAGRFVLGAGRGVRIDTPGPALRHDPFRFGHELLSETPSLRVRVHGDPVEVEAVDRTGDRAETGVTEETILLFGEEEEVAARLALRQPLVDELLGDRGLLLREEPRRADKSADRLPVSGITSSR